MKRLLFILPLLTLPLALACANGFANKSVNIGDKEHIKPSSEHILIQGSLHCINFGDSIWLNRHSEQMLSTAKATINPVKAHTPSGITIDFATNSRVVVPIFSQQPNANATRAVFAIYKDGKAVSSVKDFDFTLENPTGEMTHWTLVMPITNGVTFGGLDVQEGAEFETIEPDRRKAYVAIGDSITHGVGQYSLSSDGTYPWIVAQNLDLRLYNLGVGGSKITSSIATDFDELDVEVITILWGYNDWNAKDRRFEQLGEDYKLLLEKLRRSHRKAMIYAILPTYTLSKESKYREPKVSIDPLRQVQKEAIESLIEAGDDRLVMIDGWEISTAEDLKDKVHFSEEGARRFAQRLTAEINKYY